MTKPNTETTGEPKRYVASALYEAPRPGGISVFLEADHDRIVAALQSRIDALMLEYCPEDMTPEQVKTWVEHQVAEGETPRTDSAVVELELKNGTPCASVTPYFARQLERENASLRTQLAQAQNVALEEVKKVIGSIKINCHDKIGPMHSAGFANGVKAAIGAVTIMQESPKSAEGEPG